MGLDRAPEVKTLRRKLARLAAAGCAAKFGQALAQRRVASRGEALGFLYVDGHVRVYHGQHRLPKAHVARMRLSMPATSDYWVNDSAGDPLFVITAEANAGLVRMLPEVLKQVRSLVGKRGVTVVFDRGGFSPKLFEQILAADFDILTSRRDLPAAQVAYWMFNRWRQENFFKYLREEYALDALADHAVVPDDPTREVPNPAWAAADARLHQAYAHLERLQAEYGLEASNNIESRRRTMRGFKIAHGKLGKDIDKAMQQVLLRQKQRAALPKRIPLQALPGDPVVKLAPERKHLTNLLKMVAYQAESDLLRAVTPHYSKSR